MTARALIRLTRMALFVMRRTPVGGYRGAVMILSVAGGLSVKGALLLINCDLARSAGAGVTVTGKAEGLAVVRQGAMGR